MIVVGFQPTRSGAGWRWSPAAGWRRERTLPLDQGGGDGAAPPPWWAASSSCPRARWRRCRCRCASPRWGQASSPSSSSAARCWRAWWPRRWCCSAASGGWHPLKRALIPDAENKRGARRPPVWERPVKVSVDADALAVEPARTASDRVVHLELDRGGVISKRATSCHLEVDVGLDEVLLEHVALEQVVVVLGERLERLAERAADGRDLLQLGRGRSYRSLSMAEPGSILFRMPSMPAMNRARRRGRGSRPDRGSDLDALCLRVVRVGNAAGRRAVAAE